MPTAWARTHPQEGIGGGVRVFCVLGTPLTPFFWVVQAWTVWVGVAPGACRAVRSLDEVTVGSG